MIDLRAQLTASLGTAYTLERELGGGGMSRVFVAMETALGRSVVVKVLLPELVYGVSVDRFKREIALAARLQHPHIVPLLSAGETDGLPYFCMPFVEGESLRARLARTGELPIADAVRVLRDVASALAYAHGKGVVHRDIKPENILLTGEHAVVTDFGVAKALAAAAESGGGSLTSTGMALGTPAYMAPEQAAADPATDQRADLYAFGVVAYEILTGEAPFAGRPAAALMAAHMMERPEPVGSRRSAISGALAALVMSCLEKRPADRPQRAEEVLRTLDGLAISSGEPVPAASARPSVAVLPMVNTSGDPENEHFSDGLTDELIGALGKVESLTVTGRTSSFALKGKGLDIRAIAEKLKVATVLEGSVRRAGNRLKVSVQLVNADGSVVWSDGYDRKVEDVFAVQEEIAQAVVRALEVRLGSAQGPLVRPATSDLTAYDLYLKGRFVRQRMGADDMRLSIDYFEQAIALDPSYARAYAWLSDAHWLLVVLGSRSPDEEVPRARTYAAKALALDGTLAEAHWAVAQLRFGADHDWQAAERDFQKSLALDPGFTEARHLHAICLLAQNRIEESISELRRVLAADPLLAAASNTLGRVYLSLRQPDNAIRSLREAVALQPGFSLARSYLGHAYLQKGMAVEAIAEFERAAAAGPPSESAQLAYAYAAVGRRSEAEAILRGLVADGGYPPPFQIAMAYTGLGDTVEAFRWLERGYEAGDPWITMLNIDRAFDPLRGDDRFAGLVRRLGLTPAAGTGA